MRIAVALLGLSVVGCAGMDDGDTDVDTGESTSAVVVNNKLAANKLAANKLAANKLAANKLAANKLAANKLELNNVGANELLETDEGREVLSFIVSCAIKEGNTLVATTAGGETYEFFGELGLADRWLDHPVDDVGAGWVSACLFARVNASNVPIPISLRGPTHKLTADADERAGWTLEEGAFYGNFFTDEGEDIDWNACTGSDQAAGETGGLVERDCAEPDGNTGLTKCGFKYAGACGDFAEDYACKSFNEHGTYYKKCQDNPAYGHGNRSKVYKEVITVYLTP